MNIQRFEEYLSILNSYSSEGEGVNRLAYTQQEKEAKNFLIYELVEEGLDVRMDSVGNIIAKREGTDGTLPAVAFGSHIDTVYNGGEYDGALGVVSALEIIKSLNEQKIKTENPIEVIIFTAEESARFGVSTIGSRFMAGQLKDVDVKRLEDKDGVTLENAFFNNSLNIKDYRSSVRDSNELKAFIELHIEQGPILEENDLNIGIVQAVAAPLRFEINIDGEAAHSGTTPINYRHDALSGAAELILAIEEVAKTEYESGTVATVGDLTIKPGAMNIVPGTAQMMVDIRSISKSSKERVHQHIEEKLQNIAERRRLTFNLNIISNEEAMPMSESISDRAEKICVNNDIKYIHMNSGAGHDAMNMSYLCPASIIFVPSRNGLSHNPKEFTDINDISKGLDVLVNLIIELSTRSD